MSAPTATTDCLPVAHAPCGPECQHAQPLLPPHEDWVWCNCRRVALYVCHVSTECRWFTPRLANAEPPRPLGRPQPL